MPPPQILPWRAKDVLTNRFLDPSGSSAWVGRGEVLLIITWVLCSEIASPFKSFGHATLIQVAEVFPYLLWWLALHDMLVLSQYSGQSRIKDTCPSFFMQSYRSKMKDVGEQNFCGNNDD